MKEHLPVALVLVTVGIGWLMLGLRALSRLIRSNEEMERYGFDGNPSGELPHFPVRNWSKNCATRGSDIRQNGLTGPAIFFGIIIYVIAYCGLTS